MATQQDLDAVRLTIKDLEAADDGLRHAERLENHRSDVIRVRFKLNRLLDSLRQRTAWMEREISQTAATPARKE
jgi:hypothetical protein